MSGKSLPDVGGGNALSGFPNGLGPPSKSSTSLVGFARLPLPPTMVNVPAGGGLLAGYLIFEIFSCLISSVPAFATVAPADAKDPKFPAYFGAIIVDYDSKAAEGYCYDGVSDDKFPGTLAGSVYLSITQDDLVSAEDSVIAVDADVC